MSKTIVMVGGQNINTESDLDLTKLLSVDFTNIIDKETGNDIIINTKQVAYVVNRA